MRINEKIERSNKKITAHGGTILLRKLIEWLKSEQTLNACIHDDRPRSYKPADIIRPIILMLHTGGTHLEDVGRMAEDEALCRLHQLLRIPHPTTSRWCNYHGTGFPAENHHPDKPDRLSCRNRGLLSEGRFRMISTVTNLPHCFWCIFAFQADQEGSESVWCRFREFL